MADGKQSEAWIIGDEAYFQPEGTNEFVSAWLDFDGQRHDKDFPDLLWLNSSNFAGTETKNGIETYVYKSAAVQNITPETTPKTTGETHTSSMQGAMKEAQALPTTSTTVWIDQKTLWPVAVESNGITRKYSYKTEVSEPLIPPPAVQALVDARKAYLEEARGAKMTRPE